MSYHLMVADKADVLILDDQEAHLHQLAKLLEDDFGVHPFTDVARFVDYIERGRPVDLIMLDVVMPGRSRYEICAWLRSKRALEHVPIIFLTALSSLEEEGKALGLGADDYISKPYSSFIVLTRVKHHVRLGRSLRIIQDQNDNLDEKVRERTAELETANAALQKKSDEIEKMQDATIIAFTSLAETRDSETGMHIHRTQNYVQQLALALRHDRRYAAALDETAIHVLYKSAPLHDIGKVAIPDHILDKPGRLTADEFEIMKTHTTHGRDAIVAAERSLGEGSFFLGAAREIAYGHHEKWDGSGYPEGLSGAEIPLFARIMAVADVYDALISTRVYKLSMPHATAVGLIREGRGTHFDPEICDHFLQVEDQFAAIAARFNAA